MLKPAVLEDVIRMCESLNTEEQHQVLKLVQKYEHLFDGTLGEFNMAPISLQLQDQESKPVHSRPYNVLRAVEQQLRKESARLVNIGVLEEDYSSENGHPQHLQLPKRMEQLELFLISEKYFSIPVSNVTPFLYQRLGT
jgi:hypothetical protein